MTLHVLIVGATARAAAFSAVRAGYRVSAADRFGDADLVRLCTHYVPFDEAGAMQTLLRCVAAGHDAPQAWLYTGGLENHPHTVDHLAARLPLCGNRGAVLSRVRRPEFLFRIGQRVALPVAPWQSSSQGLPRDGSWLRKKIAGSGGCHVRPWCEHEMQPTAPSVKDGGPPPCGAPSAQARSQPRRSAAASKPTERAPRGWYYQRRIEGLPASALYVAAAGRAVLLAASQQWVGARFGAPQPFAYAGSIGPLRLVPTVREQLTKLGDALAAEAGLVGLFGVDFILREQTVWPLEINPRFTASAEIVEPWLPASAIALHVAACLEGRLPERPPLESPSSASLPAGMAGYSCAKRIVYAPREICIEARHVEAMLACEARGPLPALADIPVAGGRIERNAPIATVIACGTSPSQTEQLIERRIAWLHALLR